MTKEKENWRRIGVKISVNLDKADNRGWNNGIMQIRLIEGRKKTRKRQADTRGKKYEIARKREND